MKFTVSPDIEVPAQTFPGLYPMYYITADSGVICPTCVNAHRTLCADSNDPQWHVVLSDINYEDPQIFCDHCNDRIESAYAEPDSSE